MENKGMAEGSELDPFMYSKRKENKNIIFI